MTGREQTKKDTPWWLLAGREQTSDRCAECGYLLWPEPNRACPRCTRLSATASELTP